MPSWLPTPTQAHWLRVGLGRETGDLSGLGNDAQDASIRRLVPLVYAAAADRLDPESRAFARKVVRATWVDTQMKLRQVSAVIAELQSHGIETCLLKGTGLFEAAYDGQAAKRPISDVDVLFHRNHSVAVITHLKALGYSTPSKAEFGPDSEAAYAGANFFRGRHDGIDVHWKINHWQGDAELQDRMWDRRIPARIADVETTTLCRTDHLVHTFLHGCADNEFHPCRWVADAALLIEKATPRDPIDWDLFVDECQRARVVIGARTALQWLSHELGVAVPTTVLKRLAEAEVHSLDRLTAWVRGQPANRRTMAARLLVVDFAHRTTGFSARRRARIYPAYLRDSIRRGDTPVVRTAARIISRGLSAKP